MKIKHITFIILPILLIIGIPYGCHQMLKEQTGSAATPRECSIDGLPSGARDISYFIPGAFGPNTFYEFTTGEKGYREWVKNKKERNPNIGPITKEQYITVHRFDPILEAVKMVEINGGLCAEWRHTDQAVYLVYDKSSKRAYYHYHSR